MPAPLPRAAANASVDMAMPSMKMEIGFIVIQRPGRNRQAIHAPDRENMNRSLVSPNRMVAYTTAGRAEYVDISASCKRSRLLPKETARILSIR